MKLRSMYSLLLMFLFGTILAVSCKKDIKNDSTPVSPGDPFPIPAASPVNGSVSGLIVDENNTPVDGAVAKLGTLSATTNAKGIFSFDHATLDKYITTVTVEMPGYFKAYRSFSANATRNYISIKLLPKTISGTVNSTAGGTVSLANGTQLSFQANSVVIKSSGAAYSGNVKVYATYIDPTASDIGATVPGSFMGRDDNNLYTLQSTGMIAVDLEADNGEALQLASNLPATIKMPIPASLLSKAPSNIDTWSLDEQGVWKKEGSAPRAGDFYEMQVTHFSFWNCDVPCNAIYLTLHVQDQNGNSLPNILVQLTVPNNTSWWTTTYGYTDSLGNVSGMVPGAQDIQMNIFTNLYSCTTPIYTQTIGPFTSNASLTVTVTIPPAQVVTISGTATDCSGSPIANGTAIIYTGLYGYYNTTVLNGQYSITVTDCISFDTVNVTIVDYMNSSQANSGSIAVSGNTITVPPIIACGSATAATFTFGGVQGNCEGGPSTGTYTLGTPLTGNSIFSILVNVTTPGSYNITTAVVNGFSFSSTGNFSSIGQQEVYLVASGTPTVGGPATFTTQASGVTGCSFPIFVNAPSASIDIVTCTNMVVSGNYEVGIPLGTSNNVTVTMNVLSPGNYYIYSSNFNGISFADSGYVASTGPHTFLLTGNGVPTISGSVVFDINTNGMPGGCLFPVTINPSGTIADYTFDGAPGACTAGLFLGPFSVGIPSTGQIILSVNVVTPGAWSITTNNADGISFSGSGYFSQTGSSEVHLFASGTPISSGAFTYIPQSGTIVGCSMTIPIN